MIRNTKNKNLKIKNKMSAPAAKASVFFVFCVLLLSLPGCVTEPQDVEAVITQTFPEYGIRVLLDDDAKKISFRIDNDYQIINYDTMETLDAVGNSDTIEASADGNSIRFGPQSFKTSRLIIQPRYNQPFVINGNQKYRGSLELFINPDAKTLMVINNVSLETYLAGVVASEMPSYWEMEALKAQAVAARTYALHIKSKFGKNRQWDVKATQANQVYRGVNAETVRTTEAVNSTTGMILCSYQEDWRVFPAYYSSVCGGHTESSENVFGDTYETLKGVDCPWCRLNTKPSLFYWPDVKFNKKTVTENIISRYPSLKELGTIEKIEITRESIYTGGLTRMVGVKLIGSTGKTGTLRSEDMRLAIDSTGSKIQSTCCTIVNLRDEFLFISGKGFGHGVGLCQYGAREMAKQGKTTEQILDFYYPGNRIQILY